jgi:hypothetical protein
LPHHRIEDLACGSRGIGNASPHKQLEIDPDLKKYADQRLSLDRQP